MASNILLQSPFMVPRIPVTLASAAAVVRHPSAAALISTSYRKLSLPKLSKSCSFIVRAEANAEVELEDSEEAEVTQIVPSEEKSPRKPRIKLGDIMGILNKKAIEATDKERPTPDLRTGDIVEIKLEVPENKRRLSVYKGIVMSKQNAGIHTTIRIRRIIAGVGVEIVFPIYSPNIKEIKVVKHRKVRRARLYYLRDKLPRLSTFK
ncbi:large ribosomal subunit protein bL19cz [Primulina huaijiensis]|uniref:large ribosomal subunit protein bL19cz n=1 Tax=Primulina huaijiensis TaxID=1492673 RepID=UPI003CC774C0